jgi:NAD(P)H-flavin reductase
MSMANVARWSTFMAKLINRREVAERTMAFQFERPSEWTFRAGQFLKVTLIELPESDAEGNVPKSGVDYDEIRTEEFVGY